jgi:hypothetical protein
MGFGVFCAFQDSQSHRPIKVVMLHTSEMGKRQVVSLNPPEHRKDVRRVLHSRGMLTVLDGPQQGSSYEVLTRDMSSSGVSFHLRESLSVGLCCRLDLAHPSGRYSYLCEVVRSRPISNGRHEMSLQYRKAV